MELVHQPFNSLNLLKTLPSWSKDFDNKTKKMKQVELIFDSNLFDFFSCQHRKVVRCIWSGSLNFQCFQQRTKRFKEKIKPNSILMRNLVFHRWWRPSFLCFELKSSCSLKVQKKLLNYLILFINKSSVQIGWIH